MSVFPDHQTMLLLLIGFGLGIIAGNDKGRKALFNFILNGGKKG